MTFAPRNRLIGIALLCAMIAGIAQAQPAETLDDGYRDMYNLQFDAAHVAFARWQQEQPEDPMGPVSDAAAYLFSEFDRLHVLELELFANNERFEERSRISPDPQVKEAFEAKLDEARRLSRKALARDARDTNARLAEVFAIGLEGDYLALIEKRDMQALKFIKQARTLAERLLADDPSCYDAYLAVGVENYLLSQKAAPVRWILRLTGAQTDKDSGLQKLRITAEKGHYLQPYARLLLAVAALRDNQREQARLLLQNLVTNFPQNHLYRSELAKLE